MMRRRRSPMINREEICARLCLLTRAAWEENLPTPLTRRMVRRLAACGALESLILRDVPGVDAALLERARVLLSRARRVYACMQAYEEQGYSILLPEDERWPQNLLKLGKILLCVKTGPGSIPVGWF